MKTLDQSPIELKFSEVVVSGSRNRPVPVEANKRRMLVLATSTDTDLSTTASRLVDIAGAYKCPILLIGLCADASQEPGLRRQLVTLAAMLQTTGASIETRIESDRNWLMAIDSILRPDDIVVCFGGKKSTMHQRLLEHFDGANSAAVVYLIREPSGHDIETPTWTSGALGWAGSIGIIVAFFWLQVNIGQAFSGATNTIALVLSILVEFFALLLWNSLVG
jgi:hypothetical protein